MRRERKESNTAVVTFFLAPCLVLVRVPPFRACNLHNLRNRTLLADGQKRSISTTGKVLAGGYSYRFRNLLVILLLVPIRGQRSQLWIPSVSFRFRCAKIINILGLVVVVVVVNSMRHPFLFSVLRVPAVDIILP